MKFNSKNTFFLIDGSSFLYRAYYGTRPLHTSKGEPVNAVYTFCRMIKRLIEKFGPSSIVLVWDSKGPTTRHEFFENYKATRQAPPSDLFDQKAHIQEFADLIGLHQLSRAGYEADDLMYSLAHELGGNGKNVMYITSDKDMGQALDQESAYLYDFFKDELLSKQAVEEKFGFPVEKLPFYFALLGDTSDNIPGVYGIGKKGAQDLVNQFDSLEDMYARIDEVKKPRMKAALQENKDNAFLSRKLFLLQRVATGVTQEDAHFDLRNWIKAQPLFRKLELKSLMAELGVTKEQQESLLEQKREEIKRKNFQCVTTPAALFAVVQEIEAAGECALDTECDGISPLQTNMVGISICTNEAVAYYIPFGHQTIEQQLSYDEVKAALKPVLENPNIKVYMHNAKFDLHVLASHGIDVANIAFDTILAASLVTRDWQRIGLKHLTAFYFDEHMLTFDEVVKAYKLPNFSFVQLELATDYSANDAYQTFRLQRIFEKELETEQMVSLFYDVEMPLLRILYQMERKGILVDRELLLSLDVQVTYALNKIEADIISMLEHKHEKINLNSPRQVEKLLFFDLKLPPQKKSSKGTGYSTDQEVLEALAQLHPVPALILKYRELFKLKSTYIEALPTYIHPKDNRIHTTFSQTRAATGRLSSLDPNLQNVPVSGVGLAVRSAFKPKEGHHFISGDYSQIELRVLAFLSQDAALLKAFASGHDIHAETAARLFNTPLNHVTSEQRQIGKRINFSILYGLTPYGLSKDLGISFKDAKQYIDTYFAQYPGVRVWMDGVVQEAIKKGYVTTHWGRRRYIPAIYEKNRVLHEEAKRVAINTVAQGTAAEIVKKGMIALQSRLSQEYPEAQMLLQIHDELLISAPEHHIEGVTAALRQELERVVEWDVPLVVTTRMGSNWAEVSK